MLDALECVDYIAIFGKDTLAVLFEVIYVKGVIMRWRTSRNVVWWRQNCNTVCDYQ